MREQATDRSSEESVKEVGERLIYNDLINKMFSLFEFDEKGFSGLCKLICDVCC